MGISAALLFILAAGIAVPQIVPEAEADLDALLQRRVQAEQATLPRVAGEGFTFKSVTLAGREMSYAIEVTGMTPDELTSSFETMTVSGCSGVRMFIERGVTYRYSYQFPRTGATRTLVLNQATCASS